PTSRLWFSFRMVTWWDGAPNCQRRAKQNERTHSRLVAKLKTKAPSHGQSIPKNPLCRRGAGAGDSRHWPDGDHSSANGHFADVQNARRPNPHFLSRNAGGGHGEGHHYAARTVDRSSQRRRA